MDGQRRGLISTRRLGQQKKLLRPTHREGEINKTLLVKDRSVNGAGGGGGQPPGRNQNISETEKYAKIFCDILQGYPLKKCTFFPIFSYNVGMKVFFL